MIHDDKALSRCILVLGMHRSGTSALTRCMNLVGTDLGSNLLVPGQANAKGFWEHADAVRINDALLSDFGLAWWSLDPLPAGWLDSEAAQRAVEDIRVLVRRDFQDVPLWGLKDPRLCRLAPLWVRALRELGIAVYAVLMTRPPLEVARSLTRAHGMSEATGVLSWLQHLGDAVQATERLPRALIGYDHLLADPMATLERVGRDLDLAWPIAPASREQAMRAFLQADMRHHRADQDASHLPVLVQQACAATEEVANGSSDGWQQLVGIAARSTELLALLAYGNATGDEGARRGYVPSKATLYRARADETFAEDNAAHQALASGRQRITFRLHGAPGTKWRLDPADHPGLYLLHTIQLHDTQGNTVWDAWDDAEQLRLHDITRIMRGDGEAGLLFHFGTDPQILFDWPDSLLAEADSLVLEVERASETCLLNALSEQARALARRDAKLADVERSRLREEADVRRLRAERAGDLAGLRASEEHLEQVVQQACRDMTQARDDLVSLTSRIDGLAGTMGLLQVAQGRSEAVLRTLLARNLASRLRRRLTRLRMGLQPVQQLEMLESGGRTVRYRATGDAPVFACENPHFPLGPGWYRVSLEMQMHEGRPFQARLLADYGPGAPPDTVGTPLRLAHGGTSRHEGLVRFPHPVFGLRFGPSSEPCEFSVGALVLRRISRPHATVQLFRSLRRGNGEGPGLSWREVLSRWRTTGIRATANWAWQRYVDPLQAAGSYQEWVSRYDRVTDDDLTRVWAIAESWDYQPLISVVVPTYNTDEKWLRRCIESVLAQGYPYWELCIADDASPKPHVARVLEEYAQADRRVRVVRRPVNGHISASSNSALAIATGEYIALLDHDDELHPMALFEVAFALQKHREWQLIFTDEDKIDQDGRRFDPYFKPDWNYDLLLGQNCVSHLGVYARGLIEAVGGFREGYEGSQDWDLTLRCCERLTPRQIGHVQRVLYHWRAIPGSTSMGVGEKDYARIAARNALEDHLARIGAAAEVIEVPGRPGQFRVRRVLAGRPKVTLIIPTRDALGLLRQCVDSICEHTRYDNYEIVIVDNQSCEPETLAYFEEVQQHAPVRVLRYDHPFNYSAINNFAIERTDGELVGLINNDIEVISPDWLEEMASHAMRPDVGAVGAMLYYPDNTIQHAGVILGLHGVAGHAYCGKPRGWPGQMGRAQLVQNLSAVTAACLLVRREVLERVGGLEERLGVAFNDIDLCLRIREAGFRNLWTPHAELYHHESATRGREDTPAKQRRFQGEVDRMTEVWADTLKADPAYNRNLSLSGEPFIPGFPPRVPGWGEEW